ncbi:hypothetical protein EV421DRAFT_1731182 [Armillaria borealis]|uniref:Uncharacterized protein n=1 Tax=Armillaria borealis TaxID=47425 RepID=A0AA39K379_9AGAR|nr:hypothetical protein EV421DRAFT_1731182 [Armillaria borealis]
MSKPSYLAPVIVFVPLAEMLPPPRRRPAFGRQARHVPQHPLLRMKGADECRPRDDERSGCALLYPQTREDIYKKFFAEGLPIKSCLLTHLLHDYFLAVIAVKLMEKEQDPIDILT